MSSCSFVYCYFNHFKFFMTLFSCQQKSSNFIKSKFICYYAIVFIFVFFSSDIISIMQLLSQLSCSHNCLCFGIECSSHKAIVQCVVVASATGRKSLASWTVIVGTGRRLLKVGSNLKITLKIFFCSVQLDLLSSLVLFGVNTLLLDLFAKSLDLFILSIIYSQPWPYGQSK